MPGSLPAHVKNGKYTIHFVTVEREPGEILKDALGELLKKAWPVKRANIYDEISPAGYHHTHAVVQTTKQVRWESCCKMIQADLGKWKKDAKISVRMHHPRHGAEESYAQLCKYLEKPEYKVKEVDGEPVEIEEDILYLAVNKNQCWRTGGARAQCLHCRNVETDFFLASAMGPNGLKEAQDAARAALKRCKPVVRLRDDPHFIEAMAFLHE